MKKPTNTSDPNYVPGNILTMSKTAKPPFECVVCGDTLGSYGSLMYHRRHTHGIRLRAAKKPKTQKPDPEPSSAVVAVRPKAVVPMASRPVVAFCPECGCSLTAVHVAMEMANAQKA